jgi:hypothetical protein
VVSALVYRPRKQPADASPILIDLSYYSALVTHLTGDVPVYTKKHAHAGAGLPIEGGYSAPQTGGFVGNDGRGLQGEAQQVSRKVGQVEGLKRNAAAALSSSDDPALDDI